MTSPPAPSRRLTTQATKLPAAAIEPTVPWPEAITSGSSTKLAVTRTRPVSTSVMPTMVAWPLATTTGTAASVAQGGLGGTAAQSPSPIGAGKPDENATAVMSYAPMATSRMRKVVEPVSANGVVETLPSSPLSVRLMQSMPAGGPASVTPISARLVATGSWLTPHPAPHRATATQMKLLMTTSSREEFLYPLPTGGGPSWVDVINKPRGLDALRVVCARRIEQYQRASWSALCC